MKQRHKHADMIIAWAEGKDVQAQPPMLGEWRDLSLTMPYFYEDWEYRIKPPAKRYRVALFHNSKCEPLAAAANSQETAKNYEASDDFVRWLTDWIEYEE